MDFNQAYEQVKHIRAGCHTSELERLWNLANQIPDGGLIVEIGSYLGSSTVLLALSGRQVIAIDCFKAYFDGFGHDKVVMEEEFKRNTSGYNNIKLYQTESITAARWIKKDIDLLFIDGGHSYEDVKIDCEKYLPKLRVGGFVAFHDYNNESFPGVKQAVDEYTSSYDVVSNEWSMIIKQKK